MIERKRRNEGNDTEFPRSLRRSNTRTADLEICGILSHCLIITRNSSSSIIMLRISIVSVVVLVEPLIVDAQVLLLSSSMLTLRLSVLLSIAVHV